MFGVLKLLFRKTNSYDYIDELNSAIELQLQGNLELAFKKYQKLYSEFKKRELDAELAVVINNMISLKHTLNRHSDELYEELLELRFKLFLKDEERFAKDYIYTLIMGVDWFHKPKDKNLNQAKKLLDIYKNEPFYSDVMERIKKLET